MFFSYPINVSTPGGADDPKQGDDRIREFKNGVVELVGVDHDVTKTGDIVNGADAGKHKQISLLEQADIGTGSSCKPILGAQTVDGKPELVYTDEDDNDVQLTKGGKIKIPISSFAEKTSLVVGDSLLINDSEDSDNEKKLLISTLGNFFYPVGSIYFNKTDPTNPGTKFGFGTWVAIEAATLFGYKYGDGTFGTAGAAIGSKTKTIALENLPTSIFSGLSEGSLDTLGDVGTAKGADPGSNHYKGITKASKGSGTALDVLNPGVIVYMWERTA